MVANIGSSGSLGGALGYNMRKVEKGEAKILSTNGISCPQGEEFVRTDIMRDFEMFMPQRYRTENPVFHVSLNPHPDDVLSDVELSAIAEEYMERMGYGSQPYIIYKHEDIDRHHIHVLSVRVDSEGRKINDKFERRRSKTITRDLEQKYGLRTAEKQSKSQKSDLQMVVVSMGDVKSQVENVVRGVNEKYHFTSFAEYNVVLSKFNVVAEETKGALYGKAYSGVIYSATDNDNNNCRQTESNRVYSNCRGAESRKGSQSLKIGNPFTSTAFGKFAGIKALETKYITSKELLRDGKFARQLQGKIDKSFLGATTLGQLRINLYDNSVGVVFRESAEGRLYGVTYIDHTTGAILNGSRLGKNYSANMVMERLQNPTSVAHHFRFKIPNKLGGVALTEQQRVTLDLGKSIYMENMTNKSGNTMNAYVKCNEETGVLQYFHRDPDDNNLSQPQSQQPWQEQSHYHSQEQTYSQLQNPEPTESNTYSHAQDQGESSTLASGGLGLFDMLPNRGDDPEEDDFRRRMQQRQKKKRGRRM